jgi:hypothetical protein
MATILNINGSGTVIDVTVAPDETCAPTRSGCTQAVLTDAQGVLLAAAQAQPNGGLTWSGSAFTALPVPPPAAPAKNEILLGMSQEMTNWATANPSGTSVQLAQHMAQWAAANA